MNKRLTCIENRPSVIWRYKNITTVLAIKIYSLFSTRVLNSSRIFKPHCQPCTILLKLTGLCLQINCMWKKPSCRFSAEPAQLEVSWYILTLRFRNILWTPRDISSAGILWMAPRFCSLKNLSTQLPGRIHELKTFLQLEADIPIYFGHDAA